MESPSELESHLGYWLRLVSNQVSGDFARRLGAADVSVAEWVALRLLYDQSYAPGSLARSLGMTQGAVSKIADKLILKGLVKSEPNPDDGRGQLLSLTPAGVAVVPVLATYADENDRQYFDALTAQERRVLETAFRKLARRHGLTQAPVR